MDYSEYGSDYAVVTLSKEELLLIGNALTDVINIIGEWEVRIRTGGSWDELQQLSEDLKNVLRQME